MSLSRQKHMAYPLETRLSPSDPRLLLALLLLAAAALADRVLVHDGRR